MSTGRAPLTASRKLKTGEMEMGREKIWGIIVGELQLLITQFGCTIQSE